jgi:hypothetical protein
MPAQRPGIGFFEGAWVCRETGSNYYGRVIRNRLRIGYCYGGNDSLTGEYFQCKLLGNDKLVMQFRWFDGAIDGFAFLKVTGPNLLRGGWWYSQDVPAYIIKSDLSDLNSELPQMRPLLLERQDDHSICPEWLEVYFRFVQESAI